MLIFFRPEERALLEDYLMFPMQMHLKEHAASAPENYTIAVVAFVRRYYGELNVRLSSFFVFKDLLDSLLVRAVGGEKPVEASEDLKVATFGSLAAMLKNPSPEVALKLYSDAMKLPVSHLVKATLDCAVDADAPRVVSAAALDVIDRLCPSRQQLASSDGLSVAFAGLFTQMYPGISTGLMKVLKDTRQRPGLLKSKAMAMRAWRRYTVLLLNDERVAATGQEEWLHRTQDHLHMQSRILVGLASADSLLLRNELAKTVAALSGECANSLATLRQSFIEIASVLAGDAESTQLAKLGKV